MNKQIEETSCKRCVHYEVCRFVNALAVANVVNAENCRMFKDTKVYRKSTDGEWVDQYKGKYANALYKCSACGGRANIDWITSDWNLTPFCPSCGAKMKGANDEQV